MYYIYTMLKNIKILLKNKKNADKIVTFIRQGTEDSKLKENTSMELYQKIQSPITAEIEKLGKKIEDVPFMHALPTIEEPYYQEAIEGRKQKTHTIDVFHDIDKKILDKYNIPREVDNREEIENILENVLTKKVIRDIGMKKTKLTNENKRLMKENNKKSSKPETINDNKRIIKDNNLKWKTLEHETNQIEKIKVKLNSILNLLKQEGSGLKVQILQQPKRQSYKITKDGRYGNLNIDINQLFGFNRLIAMKGLEVVVDEMVDNDFIELITKRYNPRKTYSVKTENLFKHLTKMSGLPMHKTSSKFVKIIKPNEDSTIEYYNDPIELLNELEIITGSLKSGNTSPLLLNKGNKIIDELLQKGFIEQNQHENLFKKLSNY